MIKVLITSSVLIAALLILRHLFRNILSRRVQYALWGLVLLRLLVPVNLPAAGFSVLTAAKPVEQTVTRQITTRPVYVPVAQAPLAEHPSAPDLAPERAEIAEGESMWLVQTDETVVQYKRLSARTVLVYVWLVGSGAAGLFLLVINGRFWRKLYWARKLYSVEDCALPVYLVETGLSSPCLFGLFRPAIYLTPAAAASPDSLRHVLAHETTHARHLDHLWTLLRGVCLAIYWFNPLVWLASSSARTDCELACDEGTLARLEEADRIPYGQTLLSLIPVRRTGSPMLAATTMTAGKKQLKNRFTRIAKKPRQFAAAAVAVALLAGAVSACTFTGAPEDSQAQLTLDTLRERLMDIPEDLQGRVTFRLIGDEPGHLADYWLDASNGWIDLGMESGHLMSVYQISREELMEQLGTLSYGREWFAHSGDDYFVLYRSDLPLPPPSDVNLFYECSEAIRAYAMGQVLATKGVEPFSLEDWMVDPNTLQDRLKIIPPWLNGDVTILPMEQAVDADFLVNYWIDRDWTNLDNSGLGWLLSVQQMSEADYMAHINNGGWEPIARNGSTYYAIVYATDVRFYSLDDAEPFHNAFDAIREYAVEQVLATEGTVSLLADSPATDESAPGYDARAAYVETLENLLYRCTTPDGEHWTPYSVEYPGGFEDMSENTFALADVDGDGRAELVLMTRPNIYAGYRGYILDYDASANTIRIQHAGFPSFTFYSNGALAENASHAQGSWTDTFWPHSLYVYLPETDSYDLAGYVDAWEKSVSDRNSDVLPPFPTEKDVSGAGILYYITPSNDLGDNFTGYSKDPVDKAVYQAWLEPYLGDAQPLDLEYFPLTEESINRLKPEIFP